MCHKHVARFPGCKNEEHQKTIGWFPCVQAGIALGRGSNISGPRYPEDYDDQHELAVVVKDLDSCPQGEKAAEKDKQDEKDLQEKIGALHLESSNK
jgi:hypothetical protein